MANKVKSFGLIKNTGVNVFSGKGNGTPLQYSCLENIMDRGAWWAAVHGVTKNQAQLSDFTFTLYIYALEKEVATHSSVLAWRIPETGEPGGLTSMGSHRVRHDWSNLAVAADIFLEFSCFFYDPIDLDNLISGHYAFSKSSFKIWKFSFHILWKPGFENVEHYFASMWN